VENDIRGWLIKILFYSHGNRRYTETDICIKKIMSVLRIYNNLRRYSWFEIRDANEMRKSELVWNKGCERNEEEWIREVISLHLPRCKDWKGKSLRMMIFFCFDFHAIIYNNTFCFYYFSLYCMIYFILCFIYVLFIIFVGDNLGSSDNNYTIIFLTLDGSTS